MSHPLDFHDWDLRLPINDEPQAQCRDCGIRATGEEAARNIRWQHERLRISELDRQMRERPGPTWPKVR